MKNPSAGLITVVLLVFSSWLGLSGCATTSTAKGIDDDVDLSLALFNEKVLGAENFSHKANGVLVFPKVYKAGFVIGGEYGEGALRIGGKTVEYYNIIAASIGFQLGAQAKTFILVFNKDEALEKFRRSEGWKIGVDGSVTLIALGMGDSIDTISADDPIVAFVFDQKGLMYNLTLEGAKFSKIVK